MEALLLVRFRKGKTPGPPELAALVQMYLSEGHRWRARGAYERLVQQLGTRAVADAYLLRQTRSVTADQLLSLRRLRRRPGRKREDPVYCAVAGVVRIARIGRQRLATCLNLDVALGSAGRRLLDRALRRGDALLGEQPVRPPAGPGVAEVVFLIGYLKDDPPRLLEALTPYLVELPGADNDPPRVLSRLLKALPAPPEATP